MLSPLAVSVLSEVDDLIDRFGAYAGFASILGLALLSLLYIAQARELKRLREWAGEMPERVGDLQGRMTPAAPARVTPEAAPRPRPGQPATPAAKAAAAPAPVAMVPPATAAAAATGDAEADEKPEAEPESPPAAEPEQPPLVPGKSGADGSKVADLDAAQVQAAPVRPVNPLERARNPQTARAAGVPPSSEGRSRGPIIGAAVAALAVVAAVVYFLLLSGDGSDAPTRDVERKPVAEQTTTTTARTTAPSNASTSVFVLNGTTTNGLARGLANTLEKDGFTIKGTDTAADQTRSATIVLFAPGKRSQALKVAEKIGKGADVVQPIDSGTQALSQGASVVVVVGADQNVTNPG